MWFAGTHMWVNRVGGCMANGQSSPQADNRGCALCAISRLMPRSKIHSLYHFVSDCKQARGNDNPKRLGRFDVDR